jgi:cell wall-associated NlpC family hydrolase
MNFPFAVVSLASLDLRVRPDHRAEMASQLLLGETVRLGAGRRGWRRVTNQADGYSGWVREWGLVHASALRVTAWRRKATALVRVPVALLRATPAGGIGVGPVFLGSRAIPGRVSKGWVQLELPDARRGWVERSALALPGDAAPSIVDRMTSLLGTPYLWGGRTPAGFDCSAFVQQVLLEQGISLPRDAAEQRRASKPLRDGEEPRAGDLAFFAERSGRIGHVGVSLGAGLFAHARGRVCLASLERSNALYDKELMPQFVGWSRPPSGAKSTSRRRPARPG